MSLPRSSRAFVFCVQPFLTHTAAPSNNRAAIKSYSLLVAQPADHHVLIHQRASHHGGSSDGVSSGMGSNPIATCSLSSVGSISLPV